jgi:hypothetical protein
MGNLVLAGASSGSTTITPASTGTYTVTLPASDGTLQTSGSGYTTNGVAYATSTSALATGSGLTYNGTALVAAGAIFKANGSPSLSVASAGEAILAPEPTYGAFLYGRGATYDVTIGQRSTNVALAIPTGTSNVYIPNSLGIGTSSPNRLLSLYATQPVFQITNVASGNTQGTIQYQVSGSTDFVLDNQGSGSGGNIIFTQAGAERMRIATDASLLVGTSTSGGWQGNARTEIFSSGGAGFGGAGGVALSVYQSGSSVVAQNIRVNATSTAFIQFQYNGATTVGSITTNGSSTSYVTSSDYRLKDNITPMTGALAKVAQLKPVTYKWKADNSDGQGFIAHELQKIIPDAVVGQKDEVDENGNPRYQGIDTSFLVATLTSAIQEQQTIIQSLTERIIALESKGA